MAVAIDSKKNSLVSNTIIQLCYCITKEIKKDDIVGFTGRFEFSGKSGDLIKDIVRKAINHFKAIPVYVCCEHLSYGIWALSSQQVLGGTEYTAPEEQAVYLILRLGAKIELLFLRERKAKSDEKEFTGLDFTPKNQVAGELQVNHKDLQNLMTMLTSASCKSMAASENEEKDRDLMGMGLLGNKEEKGSSDTNNCTNETAESNVGRDDEFLL